MINYDFFFSFYFLRFLFTADAWLGLMFLLLMYKNSVRDPVKPKQNISRTQSQRGITFEWRRSEYAVVWLRWMTRVSEKNRT